MKLPISDYGPGDSLELLRGNYDPGDECGCEVRFNPDQARDEHGKWSATGGGGAGTEAPVRVHTIRQAIDLLGRGKGIMFERPHQAVTLLHRLDQMAKDAQAKGQKAPTYDLCKVSIPGTNLFCHGNLDIPRDAMPQLRGVPRAGSPADKLPRDDRGEVDLADGFRNYLKGLGYQTQNADEHADRLRASQNQLDGTKVAGIMGALEKGDLKPSRIFVSEENYILDGHHRWAAYVGAGLEGIHQHMPVERINLPALLALNLAQEYAQDQGIAQEGLAQGYQKASRAWINSAEHRSLYPYEQSLVDAIDLRYKEDI